MSDKQRASKAPSQPSSNPDTGVFSASGAAQSSREPARTPMRPASHGFSSFGGGARKASWDERSRDPEGETKNYRVPPELIELARANQRGRGEVGTLTPLAPKPPEDVVVVVPAAARVARDLEAAVGLATDSSHAAPPVPIGHEDSGHDPGSEPTVVYGAGGAGAAASAMALLDEPSCAARPPLADLMSDAAESASGVREAANVRPSSRRSSRRARRSASLASAPLVSAAARAATPETAQSNRYLGYVVGGAIVGAYVIVCYYANALLAGLP